MEIKDNGFEPPTAEPPAIRVTVEQQGQDSRELQFRKGFLVGREDRCEVQILSPGVSRRHAQVSFEQGRWWIEDLQSANGTFFQGQRISKIPLGAAVKVVLGVAGDVSLLFRLEQPSAAAMTLHEAPPSVTQVIRQYFAPASGERPGEHTLLIRGAFKRLQLQQKKKYLWIIGGVLVIALALAAYAYVQHLEVKKQKTLATKMFYSIKSMELELNHLQLQASADRDAAALTKAEQVRSRQSELIRNYEKFLEQINFYKDAKWSETDRVILHTARIFGECELGMPQEFLDEVYRYIKQWKKTDRLQRALAIARENGFHRIVPRLMLEQHLPPQFFYLALQESDFDSKTVGPPTRFGIAKGIWQFIPATATRYRLKNAPLLGIPQ